MLSKLIAVRVLTAVMQLKSITNIDVRPSLNAPKIFSLVGLFNFFMSENAAHSIP